MTDSTPTSGIVPEQRHAAVHALIAKCWSDDAFKQSLIDNPVAVMKAQGIDVPDGISVKVHDASQTHFVLALPARPTDLSDEQLDSIAAGNFKEKLEDFLFGWGGEWGEAWGRHLQRNPWMFI